MRFFYLEVMDTQQEGGQGSPGGDTLHTSPQGNLARLLASGERLYLPGDLPVEVCHCHLQIRDHPQKSDPACNRAQQIDSDEAELQIKEFSLFASHDPHTFFECLHGFDVDVVGQEEHGLAEHQGEDQVDHESHAQDGGAGKEESYGLLAVAVDAKSAAREDAQVGQKKDHTLRQDHAVRMMLETVEEVLKADVIASGGVKSDL